MSVEHHKWLKPSFAGPLIRIIGDRFVWQVKAAILHTLGLLIGKAGPGLKPFVPQLQTTFLKCLSDQVTRPPSCSVSQSHSVHAVEAQYLETAGQTRGIYRRLDRCGKAPPVTLESSQR